MGTIVSVEHVSKQYRIGARQQYSSVREAMSGLLRQPWRTSVPGDEETIWALKNVSFQIEQGELIGIVGQNGAGKSTLLKILSRVTEPTSGRVRLYGRIGSLLEVGTGFHPELSGRENIFLNGSILGMKRTEIERKFDDIVGFAEIEKFLDMPVKRYSSGMYMRLAFAVAAHLEPDVLIVDEVLAVGDVEFQRRCLSKMNEVVKQGRTVVLVSHNMSSISRLCTKTMWINDGEIQQIGSTEEVISKYLMRKSPLRGRYRRDNANPEATIAIRSVRIVDSRGETSETIDAQLPFFLELEYEVVREAERVWVGFAISTLSGLDVLAAADGDIDRHVTNTRMPGIYKSTCSLPANIFNAGSYVVSAYAARTLISGTPEIFEFLEHILTFDIEHPGGIGSYMPQVRLGVLSPKLDWHVQPLTPDGAGLPALAEASRSLVSVSSAVHQE